MAHAAIIGGVVMVVDGISRVKRGVHGLQRTQEPEGAGHAGADEALAAEMAGHRSRIAAGAVEAAMGASAAILSLFWALQNHRTASTAPTM